MIHRRLATYRRARTSHRETCRARGPVRGSDSSAPRYLSACETLNRTRASHEGCVGPEVLCADPTHRRFATFRRAKRWTMRERRTEEVYLLPSLAPRVSCVLVEETRNYNIQDKGFKVKCNSIIMSKRVESYIPRPLALLEI